MSPHEARKSDEVVTEQTRMVRELRALADEIEAAEPSHMVAALVWIAPVVEGFVKTARRLLATRR